MSVYQPAPGQNSTTVAPGLRPQNFSDSAGWRQGSRALSAAERQLPATAASSVFGGCAAFGPALQALSAAALSSMARLDSPKPDSVIRPRHAPRRQLGCKG